MFAKLLIFFAVTPMYFISMDKLKGSPDLPSYYELIDPIVVNGNGRIKRDFSTKENQINHFEKVSIQFHAFGRNFSLNLQKNQVLIPNSFGSFYVRKNGTVIKTKFVEHCYYHGVLADKIESRIVIDTCDGINGFVHDAETDDNFYIDSLKKDDGRLQHIFYKPEDMKSKKKMCGHKHHHGNDEVYKLSVDIGHKRYRRASNEMKYIEIVAVSDETHVRKYGKSKSINRIMSIMNHVDEVYKTMNTRVALIGVITFEKNQFTVDYNSHQKTLANFGEFIKTKVHGNPAYGNLNPDNSQFLIHRGFGSSVVGYAGVGDICGWTSSAVNHDHDGNTALTANTVSHELGHNLGFYHITTSCRCDNEPCVMLAVAPHSPVKGFSDCNQNKWTKLTNDGEVTCVFDYPEKLYGKPKCGNGYKEKGEECDCGNEEECEKQGMVKCCNPKTCKLQVSAQCATGACCEDCKFKERGTLCRDRMHIECDFEEFCIGNSSLCPKNFYAQDGTSCDKGQALCYQGACKGITSQCKTLWGEKAFKANDACFNRNKAGDEYGNCGEDDSNKFIKCSDDDKLCGKLQCAGNADKKYPIIGESPRGAAITKQSSGKETITCKIGYVTLGKDMNDPTLPIDGTKCGTNKMCIKRKCTPVSKMTYIKKCKTPCLNGGVCNNNGNCHCLPGFLCPDCRYLGPGGSVDSGQGCVSVDKPTKCKSNSTSTDLCELEECGCLTPLVKGLLVLFLLVLPLLCLLAYVIYKYRRDITSYVSDRKTSNKSSRTSKNNNVINKRTKTNVKETKITNTVTYNNPNVAFNQPSKNISNSPAKSPQPLLTKSNKNNNKKGEPQTVYKNENLQSVPSNKLPVNGSNKLAPIGGSSPRVGKLAQIEVFNQKESNSKRTTPKTPTVSPMLQVKDGVSPKPSGKLAQIEMYNRLDANR